MGLRFRRTIKIAPGVRLNIGKRGISTSIGKRGAGVTFGTKGTTAHVGIPGTGISYTTKVGSKKNHSNNSIPKTHQSQPSGCGCNSCLGLLVILLILGGIGNAYDKYGSTPFLYIGVGIVALLILLFIIPKLITAIRKMINPLGFIQDKVVQEHSTDDKQNNSTNVESIEVNENKKLSNEDRETNAAYHSNKNEEVIKAINSTADTAEKIAFKLQTLDHTPVNPREPFTNWKFPSVDLLKKYPSDDMTTFVRNDELQLKKNQIIKVLNDFDLQIHSIRATVGPTITLYEITPAPGIRISKIKDLEDDIVLSLATKGIRVIAPMPGKGTIGIEVPNEHTNIVSMWSVINSKKFTESRMELPIALGKTITNEVFMVDLANIPHLLVAGATGQGKSVGLDAMITALLYKKHPNELKLVLIDPKGVEFNLFAPIAKHYMAALEENEDEPIITDLNKAIKTLSGLCVLMDQRYKILKLAKVRNIIDYNNKFIYHQLNPIEGHEYMPYIVVIINEFGDLIMAEGDKFENPIVRIAQLGRAVGIHIIMATQRPNTRIITETIKRDFPVRISYRVASRADSLVILDRLGAQQLIGHDDMLYINVGDPIRVQGAFIDNTEIKSISKFIESQPGPVEPLFIPEPDARKGNYDDNNGLNVNSLDPLFEQAARMVVLSQQGSISKIQRQFSIGYNRAGRLMEQLQAAGIVGEPQGSMPREVLISDEESLEKILKILR